MEKSGDAVGANPAVAAAIGSRLGRLPADPACGCQRSGTARYRDRFAREADRCACHAGKYVDTKRPCDHAQLQLQHHNVNHTPLDGVISPADDQWVDHWQREYHRCDRVKDGTQREVEK